MDVVAIARASPAPIPVLTAAGRGHRLLFLSDGAGSASAIALAGDVVQSLARGVGLGALVVAVPSDRQAVLDRYLSASQEDASAIRADPVLAGGPGLPLLPLFRKVRTLNQELGAARSVRVIAADLPGWPPERSLAPAQMVSRWAERDPHMAAVVEDRILARDARARVVLIMDGLHAMRVSYVLRTGGTSPREIVPLAARLAEREPREVWSVLLDPPPAPGRTPPVATLTGSLAWPAVRDAVVPASFAADVTDAFGYAADWLDETTPPGISISVPGGVALADAWNAWVYLPR
jgi:hypothetical protein